MPIPPAPDYLELANVPKPRPPWDWPPMRVPFYWEWGTQKAQEKRNVKPVLDTKPRTVGEGE